MLEKQYFSKFDEKLNNFKEKLQNNPDVVARDISVCEKKVGVIYLQSMTDKKLISESIIAPILEVEKKEDLLIQNIKESVLQNLECKDINNFSDALRAVVEDNVVIFIEGEEKYLKIDAEDFTTRQPSEPPTSSVLRGPREGFTENIKTNISMIRRRIKSDKLVLKNLFVGKYSNTQVSIMYLNGVADKKILKQIEKQNHFWRT